MTMSVRANAANPGPWFRRFGTNGAAKRRLICFHHAGGGPSLFREWHRHVTSDIEVWAASIPGREVRYAEQPIHQLEALAVFLADAIPLDLPFAFFGHSLGSVIGFELARQLDEQDLPLPQHLFVSACPAPQLCRRTMSRATRSDSELLTMLEDLGGTPKIILENPSYAGMILSSLRADFNMIDNYVVSDDIRLRLPITAYAGSSDIHVSHSRILAWGHWAHPGFICRSFDGNHFYLNDKRVALINDLLTRWDSYNVLNTVRIPS